jgi:predicted O-methyltransferase YrrM
MKWEEDLVKDVRTNTYKDDEDGNQSGLISRETHHDYPHDEFTSCNRSQLLEKFLKVRDHAKAVLEIGVCRNNDKSSTHVFLQNKKPDTVYIGIDLNDKSFLHELGPNIHTFAADSSKIDANMDRAKELGVEQFDFILIDGLHSINQVYKDWEYTRWLAPGGIVAFHDTAEHPGPFLFVRNLNTEKWNVEVNNCPGDWGIGFAWQK